MMNERFNVPGSVAACLTCIAFALFAIASSAQFPVISSAYADTSDVSLSGTSFTPSTLQINVGDTVRWTWANGTHSVTSGSVGNEDGLFGRAITGVAGTTYSFTF